MKRYLAIVAALLCLSLTLTACGGQTTNSGDTGSEEVTLTFWLIDPFTKAQDAPIYQAIADFEKANPGIKVDIQPMATNVTHDKIVTAISGGHGPDVVSIDIAWCGEFIAMDLLADITEEFGPYKDEFMDGPLSAVTRDGKLYAVPWYTNNVALYYNVEAFEKAGITNPPSTWNELVDVAKKLKEAGYYAISIGRGGYGTYFFLPFLFQNRGRVFAEDNKTLVVNSPEAVEAFEFYTGLYTELHAIPEDVKSAFSWDEIYAPFLQERAAMLISGDWAKFTIENSAPDLKWAVAPLPKGKTAATVAGGYNLAISKNTKHKEAAWKLIRYLTDHDGMKILEQYSRIAARKDVVDTEYAKKDPFVSTFVQQAPLGIPQPTNAAWPKINDLIGDAFDAVIQGQKTPKEALDEVVAKGQPLVDSIVQ